MALIGSYFKGVLLHFTFAFVVTFAFGWNGVMFIIGFVVGTELMQMCYRSFIDGYKWADLWKKPFILCKYVKSEDTLIDLLTYTVGIIGGMLCR